MSGYKQATLEIPSETVSDYTGYSEADYEYYSYGSQALNTSSHVVSASIYDNVQSQQRLDAYQQALSSVNSAIAESERRTAEQFARAQQAYRDGIEQLCRQAVNYIDDSIRGVVDGVNRANAEMANRFSREMQANNRALIDDYTRLISQAEKRNHAEVRVVQKEMRRAVNDLSRAIEEQQKQFSQAINDVLAYVDSEVGAVSARVEALYEGIRARQKMAQDWWRSAKTVLDFINAHYRHDRFAPGEYDRFAASMETAQQNYRNGLYEIAIRDLQSIFSEASSLRIRLEAMETEYNLKYAEAQGAVEALLKTANHYEHAPALDLHGKEIEGVRVDVNYWTDGEYRSLYRKIVRLAREIQSNRDTYTIAELDKLLGETIPAYSQSLNELVARARLKMISAQIRLDVADAVMQAFQEMGYEVVKGDYENGDRRSAYSAEAVELGSNRVIVRVAPTEGTQNQLSLDFVDAAEVVEEELDARGAEIARMLQDTGLNMSDMVAVPDSQRNSPTPTRVRVIQRGTKPTS